MNQDSKMLQNTSLTCCNIHIGFGTDDLNEYTALIQNNNNSVHIDQSNCEDTNLVNETLKISQVHGDLLPINNGEDATWKLTSSFLPISCPSCSISPSSGACIYKDKRNIIEKILGINKANEKTFHDAYGVSQMNEKELKLELKKRGLKTSGVKVNLVNRLLQHIQENTYGIYDNGVENDDNDELLPGMNGCDKETILLTPSLSMAESPASCC